MAGEVHLRTQIRQALVRVLTGIPPVMNNVFDSRPRGRRLSEDQLPAIDIDFNAGGDVEPLSRMGPARLLGREPVLTLSVTVKNSDGYQDQVDEIYRLIEVAIAADETLGGLCKSITPAGEPDYEADDDADEVICRAEMRWLVLYVTPKNAPHTPL